MTPRPPSDGRAGASAGPLDYAASRLRRVVRHGEHRLEQPLPQRLVVRELLEELVVVLDHAVHDAPESRVVLDPRVLSIAVSLRVSGTPDRLRTSLASPR
jgi:hypothetical protein